MEQIFFESWNSIIRTIVITTSAYIILVLMLRISGKRTLSKMNAFDLVVTVALGSCLATVALSKGVPLANGVLGFFLLIILQFIITWISARSSWVKILVTSTPSLLLYKGTLLTDIIKKERISKDEIYLAARQSGFSSLEGIEAIVLEATGEINVIGSIDGDNDETMEDVLHYSKAKKRNDG